MTETEELAFIDAEINRSTGRPGVANPVMPDRVVEDGSVLVVQSQSVVTAHYGAHVLLDRQVVRFGGGPPASDGANGWRHVGWFRLHAWVRVRAGQVVEPVETADGRLDGSYVRITRPGRFGWWVDAGQDVRKSLLPTGWAADCVRLSAKFDRVNDDVGAALNRSFPSFWRETDKCDAAVSRYVPDERRVGWFVPDDRAIAAGENLVVTEAVQDEFASRAVDYEPLWLGCGSISLGADVDYSRWWALPDAMRHHGCEIRAVRYADDRMTPHMMTDQARRTIVRMTGCWSVD